MQIHVSLEIVEGLNNVFPTSQYLSPFIHFKIYPPCPVAILRQKLLFEIFPSPLSFVFLPHLQPTRIYADILIRNTTRKTYLLKCLRETISLGVTGLQCTCNFWLQVNFCYMITKPIHLQPPTTRLCFRSPEGITTSA